MPQTLLKIAFFFSILMAYPSYATEQLNKKIDDLIQRTLPHAYVGVFIKNLDTHQTIYHHNADQFLCPASSTKLFTAAAALFQLTPNYQFQTQLSQKDQDYYLTFSGSPSFSYHDLQALLSPLTQQENKLIQGNLYIDDSHFVPPDYVAGFSFDDLGWYFDAPIGSIILNNNAASFKITTTQPGQLVNIVPTSPHSPITVLNQLQTKKDTDTSCESHLFIQPQNKLTLYGCTAQQKTPQLLRFSVADPYLYLTQMIQQTLAEHHITLQGQIKKGLTPTDSKTLKVIASQPLKQLIQHMLEESDNVYAGALTKQLGYTVNHEGSFTQGIRAIKQILAQQTHLDFSNIQLEDGIGSRYNLIPPQQFVILLEDIYRNLSMKILFFNSLPKMGLTGTLKDRMQHSILEGKVLAKTGSMRDMSSLSGFLIAPNQQHYAFSIIINNVGNPHIAGQQKKPMQLAKTLEEQILLAVMQK